ncbi:phosphodiester glycosidase family protein [bacterium]|nr:phosphodiester glycosidase family protein [bacterium]
MPLFKRHRFLALLLGFSALLLSAMPAYAQIPRSTWQELTPGLEMARFPFPGATADSDSFVVIVRAHPDQWELDAHSISEEGLDKGLSSREWAEQTGSSVVINAGLYDTDMQTHIGMMVTRRHQNNPRKHGNYMAVFAFDPVKKKLPAWKSYDLDTHSMPAIRKQYGSLVQNLRLIKRPRENRWQPGGKSWWSEAAMGEDGKGRLLMIYTPAVVTMYEFNKVLLTLPLDLQTAQHLEGGLQAQLYIDIAGHKQEFHSGRETDFSRPNGYGDGPAVPNVLGLTRK